MTRFAKLSTFDTGIRPRAVALLLVLVCALAACTSSGKKKQDANSNGGPAICKDLGEQAGLRQAVVNSVTGKAAAADKAVFKSVATHLRGAAPAAPGTLSIQLASAAQVLDSWTEGGTPSDQQVSNLVNVFTQFDEAVRTTCTAPAERPAAPGSSGQASSPALALAAAEAPMLAGPDRGLCGMDESRGKIPDKFPLSACFDGENLLIVNDLSVPVMVYADGAGTPTTNGVRGAPVPSQILVLAFLKEFNLVAPKFQATFRVGPNAAKVRVERASTKINEVYVVAKAIWSYIPWGPAGAGKAIPNLVIELADVGDQYTRCLKRNGFWGDIGCVALEARNVTFAFGRAAVDIGTGGIVEAVLNLFDSSAWLGDDLGSVNQLTNGTTSFSIAAKPGVPNPGGGSGNTGGTPAPKPTIANFAATVLGPGSVSVSYNVGWQAGRDPVTCHFYVDGGEAFKAQCGTSSSTQFSGLSPGDHSFSATVTDQFGVASDPSPTLVRNVPAAPAPVQRIILAQGPAAPAGYRYAITLQAFPAYSNITVTCHDSVDPGGFYTFTMHTDGAGNAYTQTQCYSGDHPDHWARASGLESNHVQW